MPPSTKAAAAHRTWSLTAAGVLLALLAWTLWPSPYSRVANLGSRGTSIIAFGDSLTAGYGAATGDDYPARLTSLIGDTVVNAGVSGDTTEAALVRVDGDVIARNPRIVLVGLGGNDFLHGVDGPSTESHLRTIVRKIQSSGAMVVILGFRFPSITTRYEKIYDRVAREERCLLIPDILHGILNDPALKSDEIHPNARGYQLMAERIAGPVRKLIRKADAAR
jgi:lysophospholipase L1-like esterase